MARVTGLSRNSPSARYRELAALYAKMHTEGDASLAIAPQDTFPGTSLLPHVASIKALIDETGAKTILDYGAGKGRQYRPHRVEVAGRVAGSVPEYWGIESVRCYDPGFKPHSALPEGRFDGVICTDVLEHCPEEDLGWILDEIFGYAEKFVYLNVACYPARKSLPNGLNAHVTVRPPQWWRALVASHGGGKRWHLHAVEISDGKPAGRLYRSDEIADVTVVVLEGRRARFQTPNQMTRWRATSLYEKEPVTIEWLRAMPEGAAFLDIGANVGMYSVFAGLVRGARVYAFEPEAENYALLNANIRLNGLQDRVTAFCAGMSDRSGLERLYLSQVLPGGSCHSLGEEVGFDLERRPAAFAQGTLAVRIDDLVAAGQLPVPACVKIDVDGFEHKVIAGGRKTLERAEVRSLLVEINHNLEQHLDLVEELGALGFRHDPAQVAKAERKSGGFKGVAEYVFTR